MMNRLLAFWRRLVSSLWALPMVMVVIAVVAALLAIQVDWQLGDNPPWYLYSGSAESASHFLSNLVAAIITMATLAISITMVVLTLAAQQLGPRLIRGFMGDRRTQFSLGLMVSTVVYLILVLRASYLSGDQAPNLAVAIGTALILINVVALLIFVHHLARSIIADNVVVQVGAILDAEIERLLPSRDDQDTPEPTKFPKKSTAVALPRSGYIQSIDHSALVRAAADANAIIRLDVVAGDHGIQGATFASVAPPEAVTDELVEKMQGALVQGTATNSVQDLNYYIHQLVEVALRALSPSMADPFTAIAVVNRLSTSLERIMRRGETKNRWMDDEDKVRLITPRYDFKSMVDASFVKIRHYAKGSPSVQYRLIENLNQLAQESSPPQRAVLLQHAEASSPT
ncbi:hypothetical protein A7A08_02573 [Methyloligella halotolerans]|uniref:DUF2254 domain-containing protein n=1 Tax=Methyloligella halotolerans TaxID=1177755 RepID=A0A1E2RWE3_9HYPH|nr:DUF2254 domain-containing protein [Methyloligella halotolerans]ODA66450.1 hypothetical protein A7A08_02573 [Methyloligella halotolerans]